MGSHFYAGIGKRTLDLIGSTTAIVFLAPVLATTAAAVRLKLGAPVAFKQARPGKNCEPFELHKFRTMTDAKSSTGELLPDADRITNLGSFLRQTSLDELPELINVFKGEMSLVGPRPLLTRYLPHYNGDELNRFEVRPGLTGWAQVHGRNTVTWDERLALDSWYAKNVSLALDLRIIFKTFRMLLKRQGVTVIPTSTMQSLDIERSANG